MSTVADSRSRCQIFGAEPVAAGAGLRVQPVAQRIGSVVDLGVEAYRPGQHKDEVADRVGIAVWARAPKTEIPPPAARLR
jgi:hypothetical protein